MSSKNPIPIKAIDFDQAQRVVDDFSRIRNVPTVVFPQTPAAAAPSAGEGSASVAELPPAKAEKPRRRPLRKFTIDLPDYVVDAIQAKAFNSRPKRTARHIIMSGLRAIGIDIDDADMPEDGRRSRSSS